MARINLGGFGNLITQPTPMETIKLPGSGRQQDHLLGAADKFQEGFEAEKSRQMSVSNAKDAELYNVQSREAWDSVYREASEGKVEPSQAYDTYLDRTQTIRQGILDNVQDEGRRKLLEPILDLTSIRMDGQARAGQVQITTNSNRRNLDETMELLRKESLSDLAGAQQKAKTLIRGGAVQSGIPSAAVPEYEAKTLDEITYGSLAFNIEAVGKEGREGSYQKLKQYGSELSDPNKYTELNPLHRATLLRQVDARKNDLDREGRELKQSTEIADRRAFKDLSILFQAGAYTTPDAQKTMQAIALRNTDNNVGEAAQDLIENYNSLRSFSTKPLLTQEQMLTEQRNLSIKAQTPELQAEAAKRADMYEKAIAFNKQEVARDPFGHYQTMTGEIAPPLSTNSVTAIIETMGERRPFVDKVSGFFGAPVGMLSASEAKTIGDSIAKLPPDQQENFIKGVVGISDEYTMGMIGQVNPTLMIAGAAHLKNVIAAGDTPAATVVLNGKKLIDDKLFDGKDSFDSKLSAEITAKYGDAFRVANAEDLALTMQTVKQAYAYYAGQKGQFNPTDLDSDIFEQAATVLNPTLDFNGRTTFAPIGITPEAFENRARKSLAEIAKGRGYEKAKARNFIDSAQLVQMKDDIYLVYQGNNPVLNDGGTGILTLTVNW